jgi:hypothetical protein
MLHMKLRNFHIPFMKKTSPVRRVLWVAPFCGLSQNRDIPVYLLTDKLQSCQGNEFVIRKFENFVNTGYGKDTPGCGSDIAEYKPMSTIGQQLAQFQEPRYTRRSYYIDAGKIHYNITVAPVTDNLGNGFKLVPHLRFLRQVNQNNIFRPILNPHFSSPNLIRYKLPLISDVVSARIEGKLSKKPDQT